MAKSITFNTYRSNATHVYRATAGGTVWSANLLGTAFDFFTDSPQVNDALYVGKLGDDANMTGAGGIEITVATPIAGTNVVGQWEYQARLPAHGWTWLPVPRIIADPSNGLTVAGTHFINFPIPPFWAYPPAYPNGVAVTVSYRFRLVSFSSITEGGASSTAAPRFGNAAINCAGSTSTDPHTLSEIYDYMAANYPQCEVAKLDATGKTIAIPHCRLSLNGGWLSMQGDTLKIGNGSYIFTGLDISNCTIGTPVGTKFAKNLSRIEYCFLVYGTGLGVSENTAVYGLTFIAGTYVETLNGAPQTKLGGCYLSQPTGTWIDCDFDPEVGSGYWNGSNLTIRNCRYRVKGSVTYPFLPTHVYEDISFFSDSDDKVPFMLYSGSVGLGEMQNLKWTIPGGTQLFMCQNVSGAGPYNYNFLDPSPAFPDLASNQYMQAVGTEYQKTTWHIWERYTVNIRVIDSVGEGVSGATVSIVDKDGTHVTGSPFTTGADGRITTAKAAKSHGYYSGGLRKDEFNPYTFSVSKTGLRPRSFKDTIAQPIAWVVSLDNLMPNSLATGDAISIGDAVVKTADISLCDALTLASSGQRRLRMPPQPVIDPDGASSNPQWSL